MPIYSDVVARLDEKAVQSVIGELEKQFEAGGASVGQALSRAFSTAAGDFSGGLSDGIRDSIGHMGSLGSVAETVMGNISAKAAIAATGVGLVALAAVKVGEALYDVGERFDAVSDRMAARTNTLGDQMDGLNSTLREAFRNSASSLEEVGNVLTGVTQSLHLTGQAAVDVTGQIDDLNRMTGTSLNIRGLGQVLAQFGVSAEQAGNSLDMLYAASAKTGQPLNELMTNLVNAGPAAQTLGLNLGELTNLFSKFEEAGINGSKAQQALNNAAKVFADANIPLKTGLADTITQLKGFIDAGNEAAAVDLAGKVFGTRGAEQFVELIRQGKLTVGELNSEMSGTSGAIEKMNEDTRDWSENWSILKNRVTELADLLGGPLFDYMNSCLGVLNDLLDDLPAAIDGTLKIGQNLTSGAPMADTVPFTPGQFLPGVPLPSGTVANPVPADAGALSGQFPWLAPSLNLPAPGPGDAPMDINQAIEDSKKKAGAGSGPSTPHIPYPADYGTPPAPGETVEQWQRRMQIIDAQHTVAERQAALTQLESDNTADQNAVVQARNQLIQANMRLTQLENQQVTAQQQAQQAQVPFPSGYGAPPRPGESSQQYAAEQSVYEAQQKHAEARARLAQVEQSATATAEDLTRARNALAKAEVDEHQAQLRLSESASKASEQLGQIGSQIDADFGVSKGLSGIVENVTKMLAGFAAAPLVGALSGAQAGLGYKPGEAGSGLMGILASSGAFGPDLVPTSRNSGSSSAITIPDYNPPIVLPSAPSGSTSSGGMFVMPAMSAQSGESARSFAHRAMMPYWESQGFTTGDHPDPLPGQKAYGEHQHGAIDVMVPSIAAGTQVLQRALADPNVYGAIFNNQTYGYGHGPTPQDYKAGHAGDPNQDHQNHVHIWYKPGNANNINPDGTPVAMPGGASSALGSSAAGATPVFVVNMPGGGMSGLPGMAGADTDPSSPGAPSSATTGRGGIFSSRAGGGGGGIGGGLLPGLLGMPGSSTSSTGIPDSSSPGGGGGLLGVPGSSPGGGGGGGPVGGGGSGAGGLFPALAGLSQGLPDAGFPAAGGGPAAGPTVIGGLAPKPGTGGGFGGISGGILGAAMGAASSAAGLAVSGAAMGMDGGAGGAAASAAMQIGIQEINRAIGQAGQVAGIAASGLLETFLPFGTSEIAQNNWLTKIAGGIVGARPVLPNVAGGDGKKKAPEGLSPEQAAQFDNGQGKGPSPEDVAGKPAPPGSGGQGGQQGQGGGANNTYNTTINTNRDTISGTAKDWDYHLQTMNAGVGQ